MVRVGKICVLSINYVLCTIPSAENKNHEKLMLLLFVISSNQIS